MTFKLTIILLTLHLYAYGQSDTIEWDKVKMKEDILNKCKAISTSYDSLINLKFKEKIFEESISDTDIIILMYKGEIRKISAKTLTKKGTLISEVYYWDGIEIREFQTLEFREGKSKKGQWINSSGNPAWEINTFFTVDMIFDFTSNGLTKESPDAWDPKFLELGIALNQGTRKIEYLVNKQVPQKWAWINTSLKVDTCFNSNPSMDLTDTLYLDSLFNEVKTKSCAKYFRVINNYDSTNDRFNATDFNSKGQKIFEGQLRFINSGFPDGNYTYYFDNGAIRLKGENKNFSNKDFEFKEEHWHPNGLRQGNTSFKDWFKIHNHFDTLGRQDVKDGNGYCTFMSYYDNTIEKGQVINQQKQGKWLIYDFNGKLIANENYNNGNLTKGFRIRSTIDSIQYKSYGTGDDVMITNKIEREIKKQIKEQLPKKLNQKREIFYTIYVKDDRIINVQLLRDKFIIDNKISLKVPISKRKYSATIRGETADTTMPLKFKMKV